MRTTEKTLTGDMPTAPENAQGSTDANDEQTSERFAEMRARLATAMESAKRAAQKLEEKTVAAAKATDQCIREHPYQTLGVVFGLGLLVGILIGKRRD